jgi:hypothetical protein
MKAFKAFKAFAMCVACATLLPWTQTGASFNPASCPKRVHDYIVFHGQNIGKPDAKYMVYSCKSRPCAGIGDRVRAVMMLMTIAMRTNRVMLIDWTFPSPLTNYLVPNLIDWRPEVVKGRMPKVASLRIDTMLRYEGKMNPAPWRLSGFDDSIKNHKVIEVRTNEGYMLDSKTAGNPAMCACVFDALFKPSHLLRNAYLSEMIMMFRGRIPSSYVAVHLRLGGQDGEGKVDRHHGMRDIQVLSEALKGAARLGSDHDIDIKKTPVALVTDNTHLRSLIKHGYITRAVSPMSANARHIDNANPGLVNATQVFLPEFVEVAILANSDCLVHSRSGFSTVAIWWSNSTCHMEL